MVAAGDLGNEPANFAVSSIVPHVACFDGRESQMFSSRKKSSDV